MSNHHAEKRTVVPYNDEWKPIGQLPSFKVMSFHAMQQRIWQRPRLTLGIPWMDEALGGGLLAGYPLMIISMKERLLMDALSHVMIQFWKQHPESTVYIVDSTRHVRPDIIEHAAKMAQLPDDTWEQQASWFMPTSYLESVLMLDHLRRLVTTSTNNSSPHPPPHVLVVGHHLPQMITLRDGDVKKVDAFLHQLSTLSYQWGIPVILTNSIDTFDLLFDEDTLDDDEWSWYSYYHQQEIQAEEPSGEHPDATTTTKKPSQEPPRDPWEIALHQVAEREVLARIPYHLYLLEDLDTGITWGYLKEQHATIGKGSLPFSSHAVRMESP